MDLAAVGSSRIVEVVSAALALGPSVVGAGIGIAEVESLDSSDNRVRRLVQLASLKYFCFLFLLSGLVLSLIRFLCYLLTWLLLVLLLYHLLLKLCWLRSLRCSWVFFCWRLGSGTLRRELLASILSLTWSLGDVRFEDANLRDMQRLSELLFAFTDLALNRCFWAVDSRTLKISASAADLTFSELLELLQFTSKLWTISQPMPAIPAQWAVLQ